MKEKISFSDWEKLDLRVGKILSAEPIEGTDKLYKLEVDLGADLGKRTLAAGLKKHYTIKELKGKRCIVLANLEPRVLRGIESQGMILAAVSEGNGSDGETVKILQPESEIEEGSKVR